MARVEWTIEQAAYAWGLSYTVVRKLIYQKRAIAEVNRFGRWIVTDSEKPAAVKAGALTLEQRAAWCGGRRKSTAAKKKPGKNGGTDAKE